VLEVTRRELLLGAASVSLASVGLAARGIAKPSAPALPLADTALFGAYAAPEPWPSIAAHGVLEREVGVRLPVMSWFQSWDNGWLEEQAGEAAVEKRELLIAWQPWGDDQRAIRPHDVLSGRMDRRITSYLEGAGSYPGPVTLRLGHEMNGNWYPWSASGRTSVVSSPAEFVMVWRHIVSIGHRVSPAVQWMWCVNSMDLGGFRAEDYWPGDAFVDAVGIDGYNGYGPWTWPVPLLKPMHDRLRRLTDKQIWVAELGCREAGVQAPHAKGEWLDQLFTTTELPALSRVVFFSANKEHDWRLTSSWPTLASARAGLAAQRRRNLS
jgi:hypothetical protein